MVKLADWCGEITLLIQNMLWNHENRGKRQHKKKAKDVNDVITLTKSVKKETNNGFKETMDKQESKKYRK